MVSNAEENVQVDELACYVFKSLYMSASKSFVSFFRNPILPYDTNVLNIFGRG